MKKVLSTSFINKTITCFLFISVNMVLYGQIPGLTQFTLNDGLPSNTVYDIAQDEQGNILFATDYGLSKFDGLKFKNYTIEDGITDNEILFLFKDTKKRIWFFGFNGKIGFLKNGIIYNHTNNDLIKNLNFTSNIHDVHEDEIGNIWFLDSMYNLIVINKNDQIIKNIKIKRYTSNSHSYLIEDKKNNVQLITYDDKPILYNIKSNDQLIVKKLNYSDFSDKMIKKVREKRTSLFRNFDSISEKINHQLINFKNFSQNNLLYKTYQYNNQFWVTGLNKGAYLFNKNNIESPIPILPNFQTTRAFQDREKNVWVGTMANGVILFPDYNTTSYIFDDQLDNDLFTVDVLNGYIFMGNSFGKVTVLKENTLEFVKSFNLANTSNVIDRARIGRITNNELHFLTNENYVVFTKDLNFKTIISKNDKIDAKLKHKSFKGLHNTGNKTYIASANGILCIDIQSKERTVIHENRTTSVLFKNDTIWFGSTNGLNYIYKNKIESPSFINQFNETIITDIDNFQKGIIIGTNSRGIGFYNNGNLKIINKSNGLLSNSIKTIYVAKNNDLWISTNYGLNKVVVDENFNPISVESYTISEGLNTNDVRNCFVTDNYAYVATSKGLNIIDLKSKRSTYEKPTVHINEIILNNKLIDINEDPNFKSSQNNIQFSFSGISFKSIGNVSFRYRLVGLEDEWITTTNNTVRFSSLPFGNYTFELMSVSKDNILCSHPFQYSFRIKRPFYHTWIFRISMLAIVLGAFYTWFLIRIRTLKKQRLIDEKINSLRYQALNAQMNPHFINNLLTMIIELIDKGGKTKALIYLESFSKMVNLVLRSTKSNLISLKNELEIVEIYAQLGSLKFNEELKLIFHKDNLEDEDFEAIKVPPMILQPIIENCLRHAFTSDYKNPTIEINLNIENDTFLICTVTDNGIGFTSSDKKSKSEGISLNNIEERLTLMSDNELFSETFINVSNLSDEIPTLVGTKVELRIPLIYT